MNRKEELKVSNKLIKDLKKKGFQINKYLAYGTKSIYLKLDYGVCSGIRISDHKGKRKYRYKFNIIKKYNGPKYVYDSGILRFYYNYNETKDAIQDIEIEKKAKLQKYGLCNYKKYIVLNSKNKLYKSFKNVA